MEDPKPKPKAKQNTRLIATVAGAFCGYLAVGLLTVESEGSVAVWLKVASLFCGAIAATCAAVLALYDRLFPTGD